MAKQNIFIGTKSGNARIEKAIPRLMKREGFKKSQATAVAIRLESIGRLGDMGGVRKEPINAGLVAAAAMLTNRNPRRTREQNNSSIQADSIPAYKKKSSRTRTSRRKKK